MGIYYFEDYNWQPGDNTLCYYSFNNTLADESENHTDATNNGTSFSVVGDRKVLNITANTYVQLPNTLVSSQITNFTILFWFKTTNTSNWIGGPTYSSQDYPGTMSTNVDGGNHIGILYGGAYNSRRWAYNSGTYADDNWHLITISGNNTQNWIVGIDTNFTTSYGGNTTTNYKFGIGPITLGRRALSDASSIVCQMGDFIIEDKVRTEREKQEYYNGTKSLYGIS